MMIAKTVIPQQFWILRNHEQKIGNIQLQSGEYIVNIGGLQARFDTLDTLTEKIKVSFDTNTQAHDDSNQYQVYGYPTTSVAHNPIFDVRHQLPLWTADTRSKSWLAAGWYKIRHHRVWQVVLCPKLIILQRHEYQGPFMTQEQARSQ